LSQTVSPATRTSTRVVPAQAQEFFPAIDAVFQPPELPAGRSYQNEQPAAIGHFVGFVAQFGLADRQIIELTH
jgi:hypothetical protein